MEKSRNILQRGCDYLNTHFERKGMMFILMGLLFVGCVIGCFQSMDTDLLWMIPTGRYIREHGIPYVNPFTFIENLKIVVQQWLYAIGISYVYDFFGQLGVTIFASVQLFIMVMMSYRMMTKHGVQKPLAVLISVFIIYYFPYKNARPEMISVILMLWQCMIFDKYKETDNKKILWWLPVIMLIEANVHASMSIMHFVIMMPYFVPSILPKYLKNSAFTWDKLKPILFMLIPSIVVLFINPYGIDNVTYVFKSYAAGVPDLGIAECQALTVDSEYAVCAVVLLIATCYGLFTHKISSMSVYMSCGLLVWTSMHVRNCMFLVIPIIYLSIELLHDITIKWTTCRLLACVLIVYAVLVDVGSQTWLYNKIWNARTDDMMSIMYYIQEHDDADVKIYGGFDIGAWSEFAGFKIYYDARPELYMKELNGKADIISEFDDLPADISSISLTKDYVEPFIEKYDFDYYLVESHRSIGQILQVYFESNPDGFERVMSADKRQVVLYKRIR